MKICLEYPYSADWERGYLQVNGDGRQTVILFNSSKERSSTAYARYLMAVHLGRYLSKDEEVDHIDCNKCNDDLSNLQLLSIDKHRAKTIQERAVLPTTFVCAYCGSTFTRAKNRINPATKYCSKHCTGKMSSKGNESLQDTTERVDHIRNLVSEGKTDREIGKLLGLSAGTVYTIKKNHNIVGLRESVNLLLEAQRDKILGMVSEGYGAKRISNVIGLSHKVIERFVRNLKKQSQED